MPDINQIAHIIHESTEKVKEQRIIGETKGAKPIAEGYLQTELNDQNRNGRTYGVAGIKKEVEGDRIQRELIPTGNMKGHDGHPSDPSMAVQQTIDPKVCSVKYLKIWMEGDNVAAHYTGTNNHYGKAFCEDLKEGELPSFSLRAIGSVVNKAGRIYVEDVRVVTWDRVYYPSHKRAYTKRLLTEGALSYDEARQAANYLAESSDLYNNQSSGRLIPVTTDDMRKYIKQESANIHMIIESFNVFFESMYMIDNGRSVQMTTKEGQTIIVQLESYVKDQILGYCSKQ